jgi:hypothetical protein
VASQSSGSGREGREGDWYVVDEVDRRVGRIQGSLIVDEVVV